MNVSPSSNSATNTTSSLLDTGSAASKVEESGDSKGFFESFKEALGFEESGSKATEKEADSTTKSDAKQASTESEASDEAKKTDSTAETTDESSQAQSKQVASEVEDDKATDKTPVEAVPSSESQLKANSTDDTAIANKVGEKDELANNDGSKEQTAQPQGQTSTAVDEPTQASQAAAAMNEGNKLLGQLDEANKTLNQTPNGKALPQPSQFEQAQGNTPGAYVAGLSAAGEVGRQLQQTHSANQGSALEVDSEIAVLTGGKGVSQLTDDEIRQLMDKGVTPEQIEASMSRELSQKNAAQAEVAEQSQALSPADIELAKQVDAHTKSAQSTERSD